MKLLESNAERVKSLSPVGIWLFIVGRVLVALGVGILAMAYFPQFALVAAWPLVGVGCVVLLLALRSFRRVETKEPDQSSGPMRGSGT